jgi:hypothetical protein
LIIFIISVLIRIQSLSQKNLLKTKFLSLSDCKFSEIMIFLENERQNHKLKNKSSKKLIKPYANNCTAVYRQQILFL